MKIDKTTSSLAETNNKKWKIYPHETSNTGSSRTQQVKWLTEIPISNLFNVLEEDPATAENTLEETTSKSTEPKPPPIHIEAQIIELLINFLEETANS